MTETEAGSRVRGAGYAKLVCVADISPGHITHHGVVNGVTGSCCQLFVDEYNSILIDYRGFPRVYL